MLIKNEFKPKMAENTQHKMTKTLRNDGRLVFVLLIIGVCLIATVILGWTRKEHDRVVKHGGSLTESIMTETALRGSIVDRNGTILAVSRHLKIATFNPYWIYKPAKNGAIDWGKISDQQFAELAQILKLPEDEVRAKLQDTSKQYLKFNTQLSLEEAEKVEALGIPTLSFEEQIKRTYPTGKLFSHLIGFANSKGEGLAGLERNKNEMLKGQDGSYRVMRDRSRRVIEVLKSNKTVPVQNGETLQLSVDYDIQRLAHDELYKAIRHFNAKAGGVVVLDAQNGEILAISSLPEYDANFYQSYPEENYRNYAVSELAEPGSVMKPFVVAKALDDGKISRYTQFDTRSYKIGSHPIRDTHDYPSLSVEGILQKSSNVGTSKIAALIDDQILYDYYSAVGFGHKTESGVPGEQNYPVRAVEKWSRLDKATMSYGYSINANLLQLAQGYTIFTTDGRLMPATVFKQTQKPQGKQIIKPETAKVMREMMVSVTKKGGTGQSGAIEGMEVAAKTGTAKKTFANKRGYQDARYRASYVGFAPANNPRLIVAVMIDEPKGNGFYGGTVAAPVFKNVMSGSLRILAGQRALPDQYVETALND